MITLPVFGSWEILPGPELLSYCAHVLQAPFGALLWEPGASKNMDFYKHLSRVRRNQMPFG